MPRGPLKPTHRAIKAYYDCLAAYTDQRVAHEGALRSAFQTLLADTARAHGWTLIPELGAKVCGTGVSPVSPPGRVGVSPVGSGQPPSRPACGTGVSPVSHTIRPDGTIRDARARVTMNNSFGFGGHNSGAIFWAIRPASRTGDVGAAYLSHGLDLARAVLVRPCGTYAYTIVTGSALCRDRKWGSR